MLERRSRNASGLLRFGVWRSGFGVPGLRFGIRAPLRGSDYVALQRDGSRTHIRSAPRGDHSDGPCFAWLSRSRPSHVRECVPEASKVSRLPRMAIHTSPGRFRLFCWHLKLSPTILPDGSLPLEPWTYGENGNTFLSVDR